MENVTENQKKDRILKSLAVGGFVGLIILIAWVSIQIVSYLPTALSSLASLADSVYNYKPVELVVVTNRNIVNTGEVLTISWSIPKQAGAFTFSYICADSVAIDTRTAEGGIKNLTCDTNYNLGNVSSTDMIIHSEKNRFTDVNYVIGFIPDTADSPTATMKDSVTVLNPSISPIVIVDNETATSTEPEVISEPEVIIPTTPVTPIVKPATPTVPVVPTYEQQYVYQIPVSDPNGFTDLGTKFLATGIFNSANTFINTGVIDHNAKGAIQFEVKNFGTKTSNSWTFTAKLPNGITYTSESQTALKPNERAILTLGFSMPQDTGIKNFDISIAVNGDTKVNNNSFFAVVSIK